MQLRNNHEADSGSLGSLGTLRELFKYLWPRGEPFL